MIDLVLLDVLRRRAFLVKVIQEQKLEAGLPVRDDAQEERVFGRIADARLGSRSGYDDETISRVFEALFVGSEGIAADTRTDDPEGR